MGSSIRQQISQRKSKNYINNQQQSRTSMNWQRFQCSRNLFTTKRYVCHSANESRGRKVLKGFDDIRFRSGSRFPKISIIRALQLLEAS